MLNANICHLHSHWMFGIRFNQTYLLRQLNIAWKLSQLVSITKLKYQEEPFLLFASFIRRIVFALKSISINDDDCVEFCCFFPIRWCKNSIPAVTFSNTISHVNNQFRSALFGAFTSFRLSVYYIATLNVHSLHKITWKTSIRITQSITSLVLVLLLLFSSVEYMSIVDIASLVASTVVEDLLHTVLLCWIDAKRKMCTLLLK